MSKTETTSRKYVLTHRDVSSDGYPEPREYVSEYEGGGVAMLTTDLFMAARYDMDQAGRIAEACGGDWEIRDPDAWATNWATQEGR